MNLNIRDYPDWLNSLRGDSPLLTNSEWEFIAEVRNRIIHDTKTIPGLPCDRHLKKKLSTMKDNFSHVVNYLTQDSQSKVYFLRTYPAWRTVRDLSILQLKEIAESVDKDSRNCSVSRGVGSSVSLLGGLVCLASGSVPLRILGSVMMGLGSMTSAGTSVVELELLRKKIKGAEKIIHEDREYSEKLWNWISDLSYAQDALDIIRHIDVDINFKKAANDFHTCYKKKSSSGDLKIIIAKVLKSLEVPAEMIKEISDVIGILMAISMLYDTYRPLFNRAFEAFKCKKVLSTACGIFVATAKTTSEIRIGKSSELTVLQKSKIASGIALDAINIILTTKDASSKSKEAKEIVKSAGKLEEEAEVFKKLYETLKYL